VLVKSGYKAGGVGHKSCEFTNEIEKIQKRILWGKLMGARCVAPYLRILLAGEKQRPCPPAENMGTSLKMLKDHYRDIVTKAEAEAFWRIYPEGIDTTLPVWTKELVFGGIQDVPTPST